MTEQNKLRVVDSILVKRAREESIKILLRKEFKDSGCYSLWDHRWDMRQASIESILKDCEKLRIEIEENNGLDRLPVEINFLAMVASWNNSQ
jgi:hypothetical protein